MHMKRLMMVLCCVCAVAAAPAAQTPPTEKPDKGKMDTTAAAKKGSVTVTGCVAAGTEPGHYMLNEATKEGDPAGAPMASYALMGGELKPHVGHKVAVTGTMDAKSGMGAMGKSGMGKDTMPKEGTSKDTMAKPKDSDKAMTVNVKSVKMIAATCS
jgi:hypothetical protein